MHLFPLYIYTGKYIEMEDEDKDIISYTWTENL